MHYKVITLQVLRCYSVADLYSSEFIYMDYKNGEQDFLQNVVI